VKISSKVGLISIFIIVISNSCNKQTILPPHELPFAFNQNIMVEDMEPKTSEAGFSIAGNQGINSNLTLNLFNFPFWYRKNVLKYVDFGVSGIIAPFEPFVSLGSELIIGKKPIKIAAGIYPILVTTQDMEAVIIIRKLRRVIIKRWIGTGIAIGVCDWWQTNLLFGAGPEHFNVYGGIRTSPLAIGPLFGLNLNFKDEWAIRSEGALLLAPPWENQEVEVKGTIFSLGISLVKKFNEFEE